MCTKRQWCGCYIEVLAEKRHRALLLTMLATIFLCLVVFPALGYSLDQDAWGPDEQWLSGPKEYEQQAYCEFFRTHQLMLQPANALSNLAFIVPGIGVCFLGAADWRDDRVHRLVVPVPLASSELVPMRSRAVWSICLGLCQVYIGVGSWLFHSSHRPLAQTLDVAAIYCGVGGLALYGLYRILLPLPGKAPGRAEAGLNLLFFAVFVAFNCVLSYTEKHEMKSQVMLPALVAAVMLLVLLHALFFNLAPYCLQSECFKSFSWARRSSHSGPRHSWGQAGAALCSLLLAWWARTGDHREDKDCDGDSAWQWHAVWHVLCAVSFASGYFFFRSESYEPLPLPTQSGKLTRVNTTGGKKTDLELTVQGLGE